MRIFSKHETKYYPVYCQVIFRRQGDKKMNWIIRLPDQKKYTNLIELLFEF